MENEDKTGMTGDKPKSLLFISIDFPPARTSGIYRPVFFTKYLIEAGWDVTLLTASTHLSTFADDSLADDVNPNMGVIRVSAPMPRRLTGKIYARYKQSAEGAQGTGARPTLKVRLLTLAKKLILSPAFRLIDNFILIPDNYIVWCMKNMPKAYRIIKKKRITHVLVTSQPQSVQVMGLMLKYLTGIVLISDFRDSWTDHQPYRYKLRERVEKFLENKVLIKAGAIINMSEGDLERLQARKPALPREKLHAITNGYNERDFADLPASGPPNPAAPLRLVYVGTMYPHSGDTTVEALRILKERGFGPTDVELSIIGFPDDSFDDLARRYDVAAMIRNIGFMKHAALLKAYGDFDVMYLVTGGTPYYHPGMLPGKVFEYMRAGKPILHSGLDGSAHQILAKSGLEIFVPFDDVGGIAEAMVSLLHRHRNSDLHMKPDWDFIGSFEWRCLGGRLNEILSHLR